MRITAMQCTICGGDMEYEVVEITLETRESVAQPGWYCWVCNLSGHSAEDLFLADQAAAEPPVTPASVRGS